MAIAFASLALPAPPVGLTSLAVLVVVAPVLEELAFRGGLQEALLARLSPAAANGWTAATFALMHGITRSWWLALAVVVPAVALGWLYQRERRVAPCVAAHAAMNLVWIGIGAACAAVVPGFAPAA